LDDQGQRRHPKRSGWTPPTKAEIDVGFREWYAVYPRKEDPDDARKAYIKRVTAKDPNERATIAQLLAALKAYEFSTSASSSLPATWLNKGSWRNVQRRRPDVRGGGAGAPGEEPRRSPHKSSRPSSRPGGTAALTDTLHNPAIEHAALAAVLRDNAALDAIGRLEPPHFHDAEVRVHYEAALDLRRKAGPSTR
jgi:hypothetical protein